MRVQLIHGGVWDGWCIVERDNGETRLVRSITHEEVLGITATARLEDITPRPVGPRPALRLSAAHLTVIE